MYRILFFTSFIGLVSCTAVNNLIDDTFHDYSLSRAECKAGNWTGVGYQDGKLGRNIDYIVQHVTACARENITPNTEQWKQGRQQGLTMYCTTSNAYNVGMQGMRLNSVCPETSMETLNEYNQKGLQVYKLNDLKRQREALKEDRAQLKLDIDDLNNGIIPNHYVNDSFANRKYHTMDIPDFNTKIRFKNIYEEINTENETHANDLEGSIIAEVSKYNMSSQNREVLTDYAEKLEEKIIYINNQLLQVQMQIDEMEE